MDSVGVRDLKQNASRVLARVKAGETVEVTERGRPVARLVPLEPADDYDRLVEAGEVLPGTQDVLDALDPDALDDGTPVPVEAEPGLTGELLALREEEWR